MGAFPDPLRWALGWTLLHSLWELAVLGLIAMLGLRWLQGRSPDLRYRFALGSLLAMVLAVALTFALLWKGGAVGVGIRPWQARLAPWLPAMVWAWSLGVGFMGLRLAWGLGWLYGFAHWAVDAPPPEWPSRFDRLLRRMGMSLKVRLVQAAWADSPMVIGWLRPVLLVPPAAFLALSPEALESVLLHELAHVLRRDFLVNLLQALLEALFFYHPAIWWISRAIRSEREQCCDDFAVTHGEDRLGYTQALLDLERLRREPPPLAELAPAARGAHLMFRIARLLNAPMPATQLGPRAALLLFLATAALAGAGNRFAEPPLQALRVWRQDPQAPFLLPPPPSTEAAPRPRAANSAQPSLPPEPAQAPVRESPPRAPEPAQLPKVMAQPEPEPKVLTGESPTSNIPFAWNRWPLRVLPENARRTDWTGSSHEVVDGVPAVPNRLHVEVPPGRRVTAKLEVSWDSPLQLLMQQDAFWKLGLRFSRREQGYHNRKAEVELVRVSITQATSQAISPSRHGTGITIGTWPFRLSFTRDWTPEAWREQRRRSAPHPAGLPLRAPEDLVPRFVPELPALPRNPAAEGLAEVLLVLAPDGKPLEVHPVKGHPVLLETLSDWAWQLAFEPGRGLLATGAVQVPLRLNFRQEAAPLAPPKLLTRPKDPVPFVGKMRAVTKDPLADPTWYGTRSLAVEVLVGSEGLPQEVRIAEEDLAIDGVSRLRAACEAYIRGCTFRPANRAGKAEVAWLKVEIPLSR